jgi:hypothetical protein
MMYINLFNPKCLLMRLKELREKVVLLQRVNQACDEVIQNHVEVG